MKPLICKKAVEIIHKRSIEQIVFPEVPKSIREYWEGYWARKADAILKMSDIMTNRKNDVFVGEKTKTPNVIYLKRDKKK